MFKRLFSRPYSTLRGRTPRAIFQGLAATIVVALAVANAHAHSAAPITQVYLYDSGTGTPENQTGTMGISEGHVFDLVNNVEIGIVPDPTNGHILDENGNPIGFVAPSQAAVDELGSETALQAALARP